MDIRTLVFIDLECTHLPNRIPPFGPPRITEIALLACRLRQFKRPFRVTDRISFCVRPPENVCSEASQITGLDNYNLEQQRLFGEMASTLKSFLLTLDQPICLIAHNGDKLDFPLLKAELDASGHCWNDLDLHTCDSLEAFRCILPQYPEEHFSLVASECRLEEAQLRAGPVGESAHQCTQMTGQPQEPPDGMCTPPKNPRFDKELTPADDTVEQGQQQQQEPPGMRTPPRSQQPPRPNNPPATPHKRRVESRFLERGPDGRMQPRRTSYKLGDIYRRMYREPAMDAHQAFADCEMLFKCCLIVRRELIQFLESRRRRFADVVPLWTRGYRDEMTTRSGRVLATPTKRAPAGACAPAGRLSRPPAPPGTPVRSGGRQPVPRRLINADPNDMPDERAFRPLDEISSLSLKL